MTVFAKLLFTFFDILFWLKKLYLNKIWISEHVCVVYFKLINL